MRSGLIFEMCRREDDRLHRRTPLHAWVAQLKLRVHAREWTASKLRPKVKGQSIDFTVQSTQINITAALAAAEKRFSAVYLHQVDE